MLKPLHSMALSRLLAALCVLLLLLLASRCASRSRSRALHGNFEVSLCVLGCISIIKP